MEIKTVSYVHMGERLVRFDELPPAVKERAAQELLCRYMNELYRGQAVFTPNYQGGHTNESDYQHGDTGTGGACAV